LVVFHYREKIAPKMKKKNKKTLKSDIKATTLFDKKMYTSTIPIKTQVSPDILTQGKN